MSTSNFFENVIVGGGPTGLTIALYLSELKETVCLIDKNGSLGGCHRVTRVKGDFTEHGPRIYSSSYMNVKSVLKKLDLNFRDVFTPYHFNISKIQGESLDVFTFREKLLIAKELFHLSFGTNKNKLRFTSVEDYAKKHNFSLEAQDYMNRLCRLTDGAGSDRFNMLEFIQLINQNFFYSLYQPKKPNDEGLFKIWEEKLVRHGTVIKKSTDVKGYTSINDNLKKFENYKNYKLMISDKDGKQEEIFCKNLFICVPPTHFMEIAPENIITSYGLQNNVDMRAWTEFNKYINDIPVSFHWNKKVVLPKVWGFPRSDWGVAFIVLSDYMKANKDGHTVISTCVTIQDKKSSYTNKTMYESNKEELIAEVFRQLKLSFPDLPNYDKAIIHPNVSYDNNIWKEDDQAYVETYKSQFIMPDCSDFKNHYFVGTHNGRSFYRFTSMESAVTNALDLLRKIRGNAIKTRITRGYELAVLIRLIVLLVIVIVGFYAMRYVRLFIEKNKK